MTQLYLASNSPRRKDLLHQIGLEFISVPANVDETPIPQEHPIDYTLRLAKLKALAGYQQLSLEQQPAACVLGADTTVTIDGKILGKPENQEAAITMLMQLSGKTHQVTTAVALQASTKLLSEVVSTDVTMRNFTEEEALAYWQTGEPQDKAGSYAIQGMAAIFIEQIKGDFYNVVGLPLFTTVILLKQFGIFVLNNKLKDNQ